MIATSQGRLVISSAPDSLALYLSRVSGGLIHCLLVLSSQYPPEKVFAMSDADKLQRKQAKAAREAKRTQVYRLACMWEPHAAIALLSMRCLGVLRTDLHGSHRPLLPLQAAAVQKRWIRPRRRPKSKRKARQRWRWRRRRRPKSRRSREAVREEEKRPAHPQEGRHQLLQELQICQPRYKEMRSMRRQVCYG